MPFLMETPLSPYTYVPKRVDRPPRIDFSGNSASALPSATAGKKKKGMPQISADRPSPRTVHESYGHRSYGALASRRPCPLIVPRATKTR